MRGIKRSSIFFGQPATEKEAGTTTGYYSSEPVKAQLLRAGARRDDPDRAWPLSDWCC
jgi:hypothetical protein